MANMMDTLKSGLKKFGESAAGAVDKGLDTVMAKKVPAAPAKPAPAPAPSGIDRIKERTDALKELSK